MIHTRTPLRIALGGGGTDLPSFYTQHGGFILAATIDKYIRVTATRCEDEPAVRFDYLTRETVDHARLLNHDLTREALIASGIEAGIEITSRADLPAGTGLGSSGAYLVGLLHALSAIRGQAVTADRLAERACRIELDVLGRAIGKQDPYVAAHGGLTLLQIARDGTVTTSRLNLSRDAQRRFVASNHLYFTGLHRHAHEVLASQNAALLRRTDASRSATVSEAMLRILDLGHEIRDAISTGDFARWGDLMHQHWCEKRRLSPTVTLPDIDALYDEVRARFGVRGGKLIGAGGGGFLLLYAEEQHRELEQFMAERGMARVAYQIEESGSAVVGDAKRAVFLDRDGVLNHLVLRDGKPVSPRVLEDFAIVEDAAASLGRLKSAGFRVFVVTNQPDVARGAMPAATLDAMLERLRAKVPLDDIAVCIHDDIDACECRKPKAGLLRELAARWHVDLGRSIMVGDTWRDVQAGRAARCTTVLVGAASEHAGSDFKATTLSEAVDLILTRCA
ncbi:MAG: HAD-IIIA family hydrolase [Gemmatimonadota bacterium]